MKTVAMFTPDHTLIFSSGGVFKNETAFVTLDGLQVTEGSTLSVDNLSVSFHLTGGVKAKDLGLHYDDQVVAISRVVIEKEWSFQLFFIENHFNALHHDLPSASKYYRRFIDCDVSLLDSSIEAAGVLGQTLHFKAQDKERSLKDWTMKGRESQFEIKDGLLGSDFAFNMFKA